MNIDGRLDVGATTTHMEDAALPPVRSEPLLDICVWSESSYGFWESSCKYAFEFHNGTPRQNGFRFCPKCGKQIKRSNKSLSGHQPETD